MELVLEMTRTSTRTEGRSAIQDIYCGAMGILTPYSRPVQLQSKRAEGGVPAGDSLLPLEAKNDQVCVGSRLLLFTLPRLVQTLTRYGGIHAPINIPRQNTLSRGAFVSKGVSMSTTNPLWVSRNIRKSDPK